MSSLTKALAQKITSKEQFDGILVAAHSSNRNRLGKPEVRNEHRLLVSSRTEYARDRDIYYNEDTREDMEAHSNTERAGYLSNPFALPGNEGSYKLHHTRWWLLRERLRLRFGLYDCTAVLRQLDVAFPQLAIHCSKDAKDPAIVAYTPDAAAGERDAQVQIALGKLLRKLYPHVSDEALQNFEARHRSDMSDEVEFITGAEAIEEAYRNGPSACMSKERSEYSCGPDHHPSHVYDAPGVALAVLRNLDGEISARTMVYTNPEDESDKRYIRAYGDASTIIRRLERRRFRLAGWENVRLRRIDIDASDATVDIVMPYIDAPGHSNSNPKCAQYPVLDTDPRYVVMVSRATRDRIMAKTSTNIPSATSTGGVVSLYKRATIDATMDACPITGVRFDADTSPGAFRVYHEGAIKWAHPSARERLVGWREAYAVGDRGHAGVLVPADAKTFDSGGVTLVDDEATRNYYGYTKLSEQFYGPDAWVEKGPLALARIGAAGDYNEESVRKEDSVRVIELIGDHPHELNRHISVLAGEKAADYVKVHRMQKDTPLFAHKDVKTARTVSGRVVVPNVHAVVEMLDGRWEFTHKVQEFNVYGWVFYAPRGFDAASIPQEKRIEKVKGQALRAVEYFKSELMSDERSLDNFELASAKSLQQGIGFILQSDGGPLFVTTYLYGDRAGNMARYANAVETARRFLADRTVFPNRLLAGRKDWQLEDAAAVTIAVHEAREAALAEYNRHNQPPVEQAVEVLAANTEMLAAAQAVAATVPEVSPASAPRYVIAA